MFKRKVTAYEESIDIFIECNVNNSNFLHPKGVTNIENSIV